MRIPLVAGLLSRPGTPRPAFFRDPGRLAVFLFAVEVVTGALLSLYYRPDPEAAFTSVGTITSTVTLGWLVRGIHRAAGHALLVVAAVYLGGFFFGRRFLRPGGRTGWLVAAGLSLVALAFLLTGEVLPWDQTAYWRTEITANLAGEVPVFGGWLATVFRGGPSMNPTTVVRLFAIHALLLPWVAFGGLLLARRLRRRGAMP